MKKHLLGKTFFAIFPKVSKTAVFCKMAKGGPRENVQKWPFFGKLKQTSEPRFFAKWLKNRKYKSYHSLISMDGKLNYPRFHLCKKPDEKTPIRREMTLFAKVSKTAVFCKMAKVLPRENLLDEKDIFCKMAKGGPRENVQKWPIYLANFGRLKK